MRRENESQIASGATKSASARTTTSPLEETASPATPGRSEGSASGPPIAATAKPAKSGTGIASDAAPGAADWLAPGRTRAGRGPGRRPPEAPPPEAAEPETVSERVIPRAACPGIGHQSLKVPPPSFAVTVREAPGAIVGTFTVLSPGPLISSAWAIFPWLRTTNAIVPDFSFAGATTILYSDSVTVTRVV